ncbi:MAG: NYN domain-containing protein [Ignavibacteria bacterium]|nr:NYN domain-containing protein [Ignavibacteria bacterium]
MLKVLIFVDFWNLQLSWNNFHKDKTIKLLWGEKLTCALMSKLGDDCIYHGTNVYASVDTTDSGAFRRFLDKISMEKGYRVVTKSRKPAKDIHCKNCNKDILDCPHCSQRLKRSNEKGIDTTIATELLKLSFDNIFDIAILVSGDADFVPAVEYIQGKGKQVILAGWKNSSFELKKTCWSYFDLDDLMPQLVTHNEITSK